MNQTRAMVLGYDASIREKLAEQFDFTYTIAEGEECNFSWNDLHNLSFAMSSPSYEMLNDGIFEKILMQYQRYADINSRRYVAVNERESEIYNGFISTYYKIRKIIHENSINLVLFSNFPHEGFDYIVYLVARSLGVKTIATHQCLIPGRFWLSDCIEKFGDFSKSPVIEGYKKSNYELPQQWFYMSDSEIKWIYTESSLLWEIARRPWRLPVAAIRYYYNRKYKKDRERALSKYNEHVKYVYVPLHMQPELTSSAMGGSCGRYADQLQMIEQLSLLVPQDCIIYIKENPKQTAQQRGPLFYRRLAAMANVKCVDPRISSVNLIKNSIGVATVTGTAGWEALFYNKPCMVFGNAWYSEFTGVTRFSREITFDGWMANTPPDRDQLVDELDKLLTKTGVGIVDTAHAVVVPSFNEASNAENVVNSILKFVEAHTDGTK
jgi:hypothetical protein